MEPLKPPEPLLQPSEKFLAQLRQEILEARGDAPSSDGDPFIGGLTVGEYLALSDEKQEKLWDEWYAKASAELDEENPMSIPSSPIFLPLDKNVSVLGHGAGDRLSV